MTRKRLFHRLYPSYLLVAVVAAAVPLALLGRNWSEVLMSAAASAAAAAAAAALVDWRIARRVGRVLRRTRKMLERYAQGDLAHKLPTPDPEELADLVEAVNRVGAQLDNRIRELVRQRNEREAVLASMVEGVLAVDREERVISLNHAGGELIGAEVEHSLGRSLQEVVRNPTLQRLVSGILDRQESAADEIELSLGDGGRRTLHAQGSVLYDAGDIPVGALVVLHDVTAIKRLENVRRDFVANVSHELKTPVTSIKGFVETLLDGALDDPADARRFLRIVAAQADRLNAIIEDLLTLSRVEQGAEKMEIVLEPGRLGDVLRAAIQICQHKADQKQIRLELACAEGLEARMNPVLLGQAIANLIDNAIKYSPEGQTVRVEALRSPTELEIRVQDRGCGIGREHLPRIFERFYRVDKARSRELGGTGLGLAIVKHVVQAHGGRTTVRSAVGEGSTFCIHLPPA